MINVKYLITVIFSVITFAMAAQDYAEIHIENIVEYLEGQKGFEDLESQASLVKHKIYAAERTICNFDDENELIGGFNYPEGALFRVSPTTQDKIYNIVVFTAGQKIALPNCIILGLDGQPIKWSPLNNPFK